MKTKIKTFIIMASILAILLAIGQRVVVENGSRLSTDVLPFTKEGLRVGFFSPDYVDDFVAHIHFSMINVYSVYDEKKGDLHVNLRSLEENLEKVQGYDHVVNLDLGPTITNKKQPRDLKISYTNSRGLPSEKAFTPLTDNKIREIASDHEIERRLEGLPELVKAYRSSVGAVFIVDEPYLNGVPKEEINRAIRTLKRLFRKSGVDDLKYGVLFASAMFDADFARLINTQMIAYVERIDRYYREKLSKKSETTDPAKRKKFDQWVESMKKYRLTTYDSANNVYLKGGIPEEADIVASDFYLSTLLLDLVHEQTLSYFSKSTPVDSCAYFSDKSMSRLKEELSFFQDGPVVDDPSAHESDKELLDRMFQCRMEALTMLQDRALAGLGRQPKRMLIGESSANGLLELDSKMRREQDQPVLLLEKRVLDEVKRGFEYYIRNGERFDEGLMYFLYPDSYDRSIGLHVMGIKGAKTVKAYIYDHILPPEKRDVEQRKRERHEAEKKDDNQLIVGFDNPSLLHHPLFFEAANSAGFPLFPEAIRMAAPESDAHEKLDHVNRLFDLGEVHFSRWFQPAPQATFSTNGYLVRYYPVTKNYVAVKERRVYVFGEIFGGLVEVGDLMEFLEKDG